MSPHADILEESEPLGKPLAVSLAMHGVLIALLAAGALIKGSATENWGERISLGGAVGVSPVAILPMMPRAGAHNRVANDTESQVPHAPPKPKAMKKVKEPPPDAIAIKGKKLPKRMSEVVASNQRYRNPTDDKPNQVYSSAGRALVTPMAGTPGVGGVGVGVGSPLGDRFGAYAALLQQLVAQKWNTNDVDPRLHTAPPAIVNFTILRDGTIRGIEVKTSSGNRALDMSAQRALYDVGKVPPLPAAYERDEAKIEFWFELKR